MFGRLWNIVGYLWNNMMEINDKINEKKRRIIKEMLEVEDSI